MELYTGVPCAMTRHARGAQHRGECRGPRGNGGGGGSQQPAETWGASADHSGHSGSRETAEIAGDAPPRSAGPSPATYRSPSPLSAHDLARRAVADESDTSSPNRSRQRRRVSLGDSQHLRRFLSLMPIEQRVPHSSNSSHHSCPDPSRSPFERFRNGEFTRYKIRTVHESATRRIGLVKFTKIPIFYRCAPASLEYRFVS
jgi:hypothetical protein